ncbi:MAG: PIN domain-containing protein [Lachnospiraceae bacterium]|nr:PIN domain-containing protein [Lachnospiraceae bacterium]
MRLLLDTNIVLTVLKREEGFDECLNVLNLASENRAVELITASSVTDIFYMLKKHIHDKRQAKALLKELLDLVGIVPVGAEEIRLAIELDWDDFEDAVQFAAGKANAVDYIITYNVRDFALSDIPVCTPEEILSIFGNATKEQ